MQRWNRTLLLLGPAIVLAVNPIMLSAQQATAQQADPFAAPPPPTTAPVMRSPATTQISFNFDQASVDAVLDHLSTVAGFVILKPDGPLDFRVNIVSKQPVTPEEAVIMLNSELKTHGYTARQMGRILKIVAIDKAKKSDIPVHFGADPSQVADTDELITQVIPVRSVDAVKLKQDLQPLIDMTSADLSSNGGSNSIIMTDTSSNIKRIVEIIANLDKRDAMSSTIKVKQLKFADATAAAKLITDIFKTDDQTQGQQNIPGPGQFFRAFRGGGFPGGPGGGAGAANANDEKGQTGKVVASADARTNTVVVTGPPDTLKVIEEVLTQLDSDPSEQQSFFLYPVKNGQAIDMQTTLNSLFGVGGSSNTGVRTNTNNNNNNTARTTNTGFGGGGAFGGGGGGGGGAFGGGGNRGGGLGTLGGTTNTGFGTNNNNNNRGNTGGVSGASGVLSDLAGQAYVVADQDTNSLLVATSSKFEERVLHVIEELDRPVAQVLIKVLIAEVTHDNSDDMGLDFSVLNIGANGRGAKGGDNFNNAAAATSNGGLAISFLESNVTATLHALAVANKLDVLSRPYILATDNQPATMNVGQYVPIVAESRLDSLNNTINTVQYQQIGITLNVTPHVNPDGLVQLDVGPTISSITQSSITLSPGVTSPIFQNRSAQSRVSIRDGQTIVIGGLMQDQKTSTVNKIPLLGDIPLIGLLFQRNQVEKTKTELLIFLTPHVALQAGALKPMSQDEMKGLKLTPSAVEPGVFDEHMRGMQRGALRPTTDPSPSVNPTPSGTPPSRETPGGLR